jgi:hypothetical protein
MAMWTDGPIILGAGKSGRGDRRIYDASLSFFDGLRRHSHVKDIPLMTWFSLTIHVRVPYLAKRL